MIEQERKGKASLPGNRLVLLFGIFVIHWLSILISFLVLLLLLQKPWLPRMRPFGPWICSLFSWVHRGFIFLFFIIIFSSSILSIHYFLNNSDHCLLSYFKSPSSSHSLHSFPVILFNPRKTLTILWSRYLLRIGSSLKLFINSGTSLPSSLVRSSLLHPHHRLYSHLFLSSNDSSIPFSDWCLSLPFSLSPFSFLFFIPAVNDSHLSLNHFVILPPKEWIT